MNFEPIVVNKSMKQALKLPLIALAMTLLSVGCFFLAPPEYGLLGGAARILDKFGPAGSADFVAKSFSVFASLFFGTCFIYTLKRIGAKNPVLLVNAKGITDNTSAMSLGFMPWEEIKEISLLKISGEEFIAFSLENEESYLKKISAKKRILIQANKKLGYKTVCINLDGTEEYPRDLVLKLKEIQRKIKEEKQQ